MDTAVVVTKKEEDDHRWWLKDCPRCGLEAIEFRVHSYLKTRKCYNGHTWHYHGKGIKVGSSPVERPQPRKNPRCPICYPNYNCEPEEL